MPFVLALPRVISAVEQVRKQKHTELVALYLYIFEPCKKRETHLEPAAIECHLQLIHASKHHIAHLQSKIISQFKFESIAQRSIQLSLRLFKVHCQYQLHEKAESVCVVHFQAWNYTKSTLLDADLHTLRVFLAL